MRERRARLPQGDHAERHQAARWLFGAVVAGDDAQRWRGERVSGQRSQGLVVAENQLADSGPDVVVEHLLADAATDCNQFGG